MTMSKPDRDQTSSKIQSLSGRRAISLLREIAKDTTGKTTFQRDLFTKQFKHFLLTLDGVVVDVTNIIGVPIVTLDLETEGVPKVSAYFEHQFLTYLTFVNKEQRLRLQGTLKAVTPSTVVLENCTIA